MRKVTNTLNSKALRELASLFVSPLLNVLVSAKEEKCSVRSCVSFSSLPPISKKAITAAFSIKLSKTENFEQVCNEAVNATPLKALKKSRDDFHAQAKILASGSYEVPQVVVPAKIKKLFNTYLYGKLFDNTQIWTALGHQPFTRKNFHENFKVDNSPLYVCPYCDLDTINSTGTHIIEHFLPKSKFPLLALDPNNLFTACQGCNTPGGGKGVKVALNVTSPYVHEIGHLVQFQFEAAKKKLIITAPPGNPQVEGFINLLSLPVRYSTGDTWSFFDARRNALIETVQGRGELTDKELLAYVKISRWEFPSLML